VVAGRAEPLPRLLVVIDEFATVAAELPDFIASLVGIAQRGRSLGVHLLLATQRPSGAVNENIRANANLRICLRVQSDQDSSDVIDSPAGARIGRGQPGRAYVRLGPSELHAIQTALVTGHTDTERQLAVRVTDFTFASAAVTTADAPRTGPAPRTAASDLDRLVAAALAAAAAPAIAPTPAATPAAATPAAAEHRAPPRRRWLPPRRPWLPPLPAELALEELWAAGPPVPFAGERGLTAALALLDDPGAQAQYPGGWNLDAGNLLLFGLGGSGTTTALQTLALSLATAAAPDELHLYALDFGAGELRWLRDLPHVGAVIGASERERQTRLIRWLRSELAARRDADRARSGADPAGSGADPAGGDARIVVLLDGYAGFAAEHSDVVGDAVRDDLARVWADGPEVGIHLAIAADRPGALPVALAGVTQQRLVLQLGDLAEYAQLGLSRRAIPRFTPGRAVLTAERPRVAQIARTRLGPAQAVAELTARHGPAGRRPPTPIGTLPQRVAVAELLAGTPRAGGAGEESPRWPPEAGTDERGLWLPLAIDDRTLGVAGWSLYPGEHALIAGPARSGRTNALLAIAQACASLHPGLALHVVALRRSRLAELPGARGRATSAGQLAELLPALRAGGGPALLLVDDADVVEDPTRALSALIGDPDGRVHVIAAGRANALRSLGHWSAGVRGSRNGLLLAPDLSLDGALFGVALPRRPAPPARAGCGYLISAGALDLAQVALADAGRRG
ncbi:MAG: FtsK/SpoIIIE domain-containing protein, partial [Solirubrobacterales bacterium]|nr:FtsK/SpoIIIE domain-containing protein [Solirubrobacterales bacterium]